MAKLYFRYGAMGSSKTANALMVSNNYYERGSNPILLKPKLENRDGAQVVMGGNESYVALCRKHFKLGMLGED